MTLVCRPTQLVRFMHMSETSSKQLMYPPKHYSIVRVQKNYSAILLSREKAERHERQVLPAGSAAFTPMHECGVSRRQMR